MATVQNIDMSLSDIVKNIDAGNFVIPKFQRDFVWKDGEIASLGDSIIRGYPISSMLIMPVNGTLNIKASPLRTYGADNCGDNQKYVLDGQQRITAIAKIFLGLDEKREYYFDLLSILIDRFPEDNLLEKLSFLTNRKNYPLVNTDLFCRSFQRSKVHDELPTRHHYRFISGKSIIENRFASVINKFLRNLEEKSNYIKEEDIDKYNDYLSSLLGIMSSYSIPVTVISQDADLGLVVRIFEKVNLYGRKLTLFDLINAKTFELTEEPYSGGIANYLNREILNYIEENNLKTKDFDEYLNYNSHTQMFGKLDRIIRTLEIIDLLEKNSLPSLSAKVMLSKDSKFWFKKWNDYKENILKFLYWLEKEKLNIFGNGSFIEQITALFAIYPEMLQENLFLKEVKKQILSFAISGHNFDKSDLNLIMKFKKYAEFLKNKNGFSKYENENYSLSNTVISLRSENIKEFTQGKISYKAIMYILYKEKHGGYFHKDLLNNNISYPKENEIEEHHLIPKANTKGNKNSIFNSVANIVFLNTVSNRYEIKDMPFIEYMNKIKSVLGEKTFSYVLEQNLIDEKFIKSDFSPTEFLENRAEKIANLINDYFK